MPKFRFAHSLCIAGFSALLLCSLAAWTSAAAPSKATVSKDWPTFRGPNNRSAVSTDTGLLQEWPKDGPPLLWEALGAGRGYASLAVAGDKVITLGDGPSVAEDTDEYLLAFDRASGKHLWKLKTGAPWTEGQPNWQSSRSTPTIDGELTYALSPHGVLVCCETATGAERWRKNLKEDFGGKKGDAWGYSESVLIDGDRLICTPGGEEATMIALDKRNASEIWRTARPGNRGAGHSSVVISQIGPTKVYVQTTASGPMGVRASDGKLLWVYDIEQTTAVAPTPILRGDLVFFAAGYKRGGALLKQVPKPDNEVGVEEVYALQIHLSNKHGGVVLMGDYLFGDSDDQGIPFCADFLTGELKWKARGSGKGSTAFAGADGCIYMHFSDGVMALAKATPTEYKETGSFTVPGSGDRPSWAHPVIVDGKLFLREQDRILCYDVRAK